MVTQFAEAIVQSLGIQGAPLDTTRTGYLDDVDLLDEFAARSLDLLALPAALATNIRLLEGEVELPKQRWSRSRIGDGQVIHTELCNPDIDRAVSEGAMVVIDSIDEVDWRLMRLREALEYRLSARAWINLYLTAGSTSNFGLHYDTCDTLIVQLLGRKCWMVGDTSEPMGSIVDPDSTGDLRHLELAPGDLLGMPARALHHASGVGMFTMHLTIGFDRTAALPFLRDEADSVLGQSSVPLTEDDLERGKARLPERRRGTSLPFGESGELSERTLLRWAMRLPPAAEELSDGALRVASGRQELTVAGVDAAVVRVLVTGDELGLDELATSARVSVDDASRVVRDLAVHDLVICRLANRYT